MREGAPARTAAVPLLLEIARARRAREFYAPGHPTLSEALKRLTRVWRMALSEVDELELQLERGCFQLMGVSELQGPGIDELAAELETRGIRRLRIGSSVEPAEMDALIDALVHDFSGADELEQLLARSDVQNITTTDLVFGELPRRGKRTLHLEREEGETRLLPVVSREPDSTAEDGTPTAVDCLDGEAPTPVVVESDVRKTGQDEHDDRKTGEDAPKIGEDAPKIGEDAPKIGEEAPKVEPDGPKTGEETSKLLSQLAELEGCDALEPYRELADRIRHFSEALLEARSFFDAYRAALVFTRHASDRRGHPEEICAEARLRLQALLESDDFLGFVIELASGEEGLTCVQATQVLLACGEAVVPRLLDVHFTADDETSKRTASILIAMGDAALQVIVAELDSPTLERARRAAQLLGDLQHPRAVESLSAALQNAENSSIRPKVARALVHIGSQEAIDTLIEALQDDTERAELAARCLGESPEPRACAALIEAIEESSGRQESVRREAIRSLGKLGGDEALAALRSLLEQGSLLHRRRMRPLRIAAAQAIARIGNSSAREALESNSRHGDTAVRKACGTALERLGPPSDSGSPG